MHACMHMYCVYIYIYTCYPHTHKHFYVHMHGDPTYMTQTIGGPMSDTCPLIIVLIFRSRIIDFGDGPLVWSSDFLRTGISNPLCGWGDFYGYNCTTP